MVKSLIFTETKNRKGKRDGDEFSREAHALGEYWADGGDVAVCALGDGNKYYKRKILESALGKFHDLERIAFVCHGTSSGISLGVSVGNLPEFARHIAAACSGNRVHIALYACLTGRGNFWGGRFNRKNVNDRTEAIVTWREGFAMLLCRLLDELGVHAIITAHLTAGHTMRNPYKVRIEKIAGAYTRRRMCPKDKPSLWKAWVQKLSEDETYRFEVATMSIRRCQHLAPLVGGQV